MKKINTAMFVAWDGQGLSGRLVKFSASGRSSVNAGTSSAVAMAAHKAAATAPIPNMR